MNIINDMLTITNASREQIQVYIMRFTEITIFYFNEIDS